MKNGSVINEKWQVIDDCGKGGQGIVYKVVGEDEGATYALKFLSRQNDVERRKRMHNEVNNVRILDHPHLLKIVDSNVEKYCESGEKLYYVVKYINGGTLEEYVDEQDTIPFQDAMVFFMDLLDCLEYCHQKGILHRDIKPENILLAQGVLNNFYIIDFGLSFNIEEQDTATATNQQLGNRFILLPELVGGNTEQKRLPQSDITQATAVFFYVLTGIVPNSLYDGEGKQPQEREKAKNILRQKITDNIIYENLMCIFKKEFSNNVIDRYQNCKELIRDIDNISERKVTELGGNIMGSAEILISDNKQVPRTLKYSELVKELNPSPEIFNPSGLQLPSITNVEQLVTLGVAIPCAVQDKIVRYYKMGDFATAVDQVWPRAVSILRKRVLSLGEDFVADMVETDDLEYVRNLPAYKVIWLAHELGFIDKPGKSKLLQANDLYNYFQNTEKDEYEEMPQDEANIIIKNGIKYILYNNEESFGLQFNDFREKLKAGRITELFADSDAMFSTCPYFNLKTTVRSLLNLFASSDGIEFDNVVINMNILFPQIWERLKLEERRALADAYTEYNEKNDMRRVEILSAIMLKVHGFDYVMENARSRIYIGVARKLKDIHFSVNNFYHEPPQIKILEDLGTIIPRLALKECMTAILYVKLGNQFNTSWDAEVIADRLLARFTEEEWRIYLECYLKEETGLVDYIQNCNKMRSQWKKVIITHRLDTLDITDSLAKRMVFIAR